MQAEQHDRGWNWDTTRVPRGRRIMLTRRCCLDQVIHRVQVQGRLTEGEVELLNFWFGVTAGHAHPLKETGERYGVTREQIRRVERKILDEELAALWDRTKKFIAEGYEK